MIITKAKPRRVMSDMIENAVASLGLVVVARVPDRAAVEQADVARTPITLSAPDSPVTLAYRRLVNHLDGERVIALTSIRRRAVKIDDPLGPSATPAPEAPSAAPGKTTRRRAAPPRTPRPAGRPNRAGGQTQPAPTDGVWRQWSGLTGVGSFRLPHEPLAELSDTVRELACRSG